MSEQPKIRVIMSFGSDDKERKRMAAVYYSCLEFMIDKYSSESGQPFDFDYCKRFTGDINDPLLQEIADADILIALLDRNVTVTYELAFRHILRGQMILFRLEDAKVPVYLETHARQEFSDNLTEKILNQVRDEENFPDLELGESELSPAIKKLLKEDKNQTYTILSRALEEIANSSPTPSTYIEKIALPMLQNRESPVSYNISAWGQSMYYPLSIIKISWKGITDPVNGKYSVEDMIEVPLIHDANREFINLYRLRVLRGESDSEAIHRLSPLGQTELMKHLEKLTNPEKMNMKEFLADQQRLSELTILQDAEAAQGKFSSTSYNLNREDKYAKVPIVMSDNHPTMPGQSLLPCLLSKRHEGDFPNGKHSTYLAVVYIDITSLVGAPVG